MSGARANRNQEYVASWFSGDGIGDSELCASVAPKDFGWAEENKPV